jgi:sugar/nucleoside kinase (ribokinase family)
VDSRGCLVYRKERGKFKEDLVPAIKVDQVIDTTGCGDSFAGGVGFGLLNKPNDYIGAAKYGNALGALRTQGKTFSVFKSQADTEEIIKIGYISSN